MQATCLEPFFDHIEMLKLLRASRDIENNLGGWLRASEIWSIIQDRAELTETEEFRDQGLRDAIVILEEAVAKRVCYGTSGDCIAAAMQSLKDWVQLCEGRPRRWHHYIYWPGILPGKFIEALEHEDGLASTLLLHWLAILRLAAPRWFLEYWIIRTGNHIVSKLPHELDKLKTWPVSIICTDRFGTLRRNSKPRLEISNDGLAAAITRC
ncbi:hypothetical protein BU23DRAFT_565572 [Bimuria novae-zelandiae CBS 107.79]|uniref:Uncharacterized protein n=1 Tax=Bimuria novae-zelandiae CBS 107.79 TaxID=1447943 RepID=A0A6A5VPS6_9PLEO|nr:hypothetical protein BU23DRAFT_565572 [Bimuria novae-zelandiae CBS 107.79]